MNEIIIRPTVRDGIQVSSFHMELQQQRLALQFCIVWHLGGGGVPAAIDPASQASCHGIAWKLRLSSPIKSVPKLMTNSDFIADTISYDKRLEQKQVGWVHLGQGEDFHVG